MRNNTLTYDLSPLFRSSIGFDRFDDLFDSALRTTNQSSGGYPPYNIERDGDDDYRVTLAVAGFTRDELDIEVEKGVLKIAGKAQQDVAQEGDNSRQTLYRGIAKRGFERRFQLDDTIKVVGADLENGLLTVNLKREIPEHQKPRRIEIGGSTPVLDHAA